MDHRRCREGCATWRIAGAVMLAGLVIAGCGVADPPLDDGENTTPPPSAEPPETPAAPRDPAGVEDGPASQPDPSRCVPETWGASSPGGSAGDVPADAPDVTVAVRLTEIARLGSAIAGAVGPGGVLYLADRAGTVHALVEDTLSEPIIDISDETTTDAERGLLGIAFAADCSFLYVSFTDRQGVSRLDAFEVVDGAIDPERRREVLVVDQPYANHNGGDVKVGPDGYVYLGLGDGGGAGDPLDAGQDTSSLLGALLRIDPQADEPYAIPWDNPFVGVDGAADEIWAYGLRNPWRFSFDRLTGALWIADVGQNAREEINLLSADDAGANLGWNRMEGTLPFAGSEPQDHHRPVHEYDTTSSRCAITGGFVYRGTEIPALQGAYVFSDYCEGRLRAIAVVDGDVVAGDLGVEGGRVVSFAEDAHGELYVLALDGGVYRLEAASG